MMKSLLYTSSASVAVSLPVIKDILSSSRRNNSTHSITGILVYLDGTFVQVIEGEENNVDLLFEKISHDDRHEKLTIVMNDAIEKREFSEWEMAFRMTNNEELASLSGFTSIDKLKEISKDNPSVVKNLLSSFYEMNRDQLVQYRFGN